MLGGAACEVRGKNEGNHCCIAFVRICSPECVSRQRGGGRGGGTRELR